MKQLIAIACLFFLIGTTPSFPQEEKTALEVLTDKLQEELHDSDRVKTLNDISWSLMYANPDTAIFISSKAMAIAEVSGWRLGVALSTGQLGTFSILKGDYPTALEYYTKALDIDLELDNKKGISANYGNIGLV